MVITLKKLQIVFLLELYRIETESKLAPIQTIKNQLTNETYAYIVLYIYTYMYMYSIIYSILLNFIVYNIYIKKKNIYKSISSYRPLYRT